MEGPVAPSAVRGETFLSRVRASYLDGREHALRSALAIGVFLAVYGAGELLASLVPAAGRHPVRCAPRVGLYVLATVHWYLMSLPGRLTARRFAATVVAILIASAVANELPDGPARRGTYLASAVSLATLLGIVVARLGRSPSDLLALFVLGIGCDAWAAVAGVYNCPVTAEPWTLRVPSAAASQTAWQAIPIADVVFLAACLEMARRYGFHMGATVSGAWTGFLGGSFLLLGLKRPIPSLIFVGLGVVIAAWPELRASRKDFQRAVLVTVCVVGLLTAVAVLRWWLFGRAEPIQPRIEDLRHCV